MPRTLAIDLGAARTGAAITDDCGVAAHGVGVWKTTGYKSDLRNILRLIDEYETIERIVVGWPLNMDGSAGEMAKKCERFAKKLERDTRLPIILQDERLTPCAAEEILAAHHLSGKKRKKVIDQMAAQQILQSWIDAQEKRA